MKFYLYLHRRPDTGAIFYIGRGKHYTRSTKFRRALDTERRNEIWWRIVNKNEGIFNVEIILECDSIDEIFEYERQMIAIFGKIIDGNGSLCNITDGGDGCEGFKHSSEAITKMKARHAVNPQHSDHFRKPEFIENHKKTVLIGNKFSLGKYPSAETKAKMRASHIGKHGEQVVDQKTGTVYRSVREASAATGIHVETLYKYLQGKRHNYSSMRYL